MYFTHADPPKLPKPHAWEVDPCANILNAKKRLKKSKWAEKLPLANFMSRKAIKSGQNRDIQNYRADCIIFCKKHTLHI